MVGPAGFEIGNVSVVTTNLISKLDLGKQKGKVEG